MIGDDWVLNHVGMAITNRNATLRHFQSLGVGVSVGPQPLLPHEEGEGSLMYYQTLEGDPITNHYKTGGAHNFTDGECQIGDCQLECFPFKPGPGMFLTEYVAQKGPGINHICFNAPNVEADTDYLIGQGCAVMFNATVNGRIVENYLDSRKHGDLMISLRPPASDWENTWKANNESHPLVNDWRFVGVGVGVSSLEDTISYYDGLGFQTEGGEVVDSEAGIRAQLIKMGPLLLEFCEPESEYSIHSESIERRGDGVSDIAFSVESLDDEVERLKQRGVEVLRYANNGQSVYLDTRAEGNVMLKLMQEI